MKENFQRNDMKFVMTQSSETRLKLLYEGFTELTDPEDATHIFLNNGRMMFDAEKNGCVYSNKLFI